MRGTHSAIIFPLQKATSTQNAFIKSENALFMRLAVARIALVKPDKARGVENMILQAAQRGMMNEKARLACLLLCELH